MSVTRKERMRKTIQYEPVDRVPTQINYTADMGQKMAAHFGVDIQELPIFLDNHMLRVDLSFPKRIDEDRNVIFDWWGAGHATGEEGYFISVNPLADSKDLDLFSWPDADDPHLLEEAKQTIAKHGNEYFITPNFGFCLFERAWSLRGLDTFMMDMALDPTWANELLERITEIQIKLIHRYLDLGVDGGYFGDDYGAQKNLLFSPKMWREMIKPRLARMFAPFRDRGLPVLMHSDGAIAEIIPDLVEIGLTTLNPVQPEVIDHEWVQKTFDGRLAFYGGISTQTVLPYGNPEEAKAATRDAVHKLAPNNTGLLLAPSHRMMTDIPMANVKAMLAVFAELG
jgi:uroporphyrinogen decarboxylase